MRRISQSDANNLVQEFVENRSLEDLLDELKVYGDVELKYLDHNWYCECLPRVKSREYKFETCGKDLLQLVKSCLSLVYLSQATN